MLKKLSNTGCNFYDGVPRLKDFFEERILPGIHKRSRILKKLLLLIKLCKIFEEKPTCLLRIMCFKRSGHVLGICHFSLSSCTHLEACLKCSNPEKIFRCSGEVLKTFSV